MARASRDYRLETRTQRLKLPKGKRFQCTLREGLALCYRRTASGFGIWSVRIEGEAGKERLERLGIADDNDEADASKVLSFFQAQELARSRAATLPKPAVTVAEAAERYLAWFKEHRKGFETTAATVKAHVRPKLGERPIAELTAPELRVWLNALAAKAPRRRTGMGRPQAYGKKPASDDEKRARRATANRIFTVLRAILNRAFEDELVTDDTAWRKVKPFKGADEPIIRFLSAAESKRLLNACPMPFRDLVAAALVTGARYSELTRITAADFNPATGI